MPRPGFNSPVEWAKRFFDRRDGAWRLIDEEYPNLSTFINPNTNVSYATGLEKETLLSNLTVGIRNKQAIESAIKQFAQPHAEFLNNCCNFPPVSVIRDTAKLVADQDPHLKEQIRTVLGEHFVVSNFLFFVDSVFCILILMYFNRNSLKNA